MASKTTNATEAQQFIRDKYPHMPEYHQAVEEVIEDLADYIDAHYGENGWHIFHQLIQPDRVIDFRVNWLDDDNRMQTNRGYRVQFNNALGPYKGGLRFTPKLNLSILHFLGFEQTFKNSLTGLPMGGAKGGADFNPSSHSEGEIFRFCQSFMTQLARFIGPDVDVPAGDIGVSSREIAYLFEHYKAITGEYSGILTGKDPVFGGICLRKEATGYGCVYFAEHLLRERETSLRGKRCAVSGAGNVALHAARKLIDKEAIVTTLSSRSGCVVVEDGMDREAIDALIDHRARRGSLQSFADKQGWDFRDNEKPWATGPDIAFACATQNELDQDDAQALIDSGCEAVLEGANMPCTLEASHLLQKQGVVLAPSKAVNAGGVAVSGLEIAQNRQRLPWQQDRVDEELHAVMRNIHYACMRYGREEEGAPINYKQGANIAAFEELAKALSFYTLQPF